MKAKNSVLIILVSIPVIFMKSFSQLVNSSINSHSIRKRQSQFNCPCADPKDITIDNPCGNCQKSQCKFKGCIIDTPLKLQWKPDDCTTCECIRGRKLCYREQCNETECFGYPVIKPPGKCCKVCDFSTSATACNVVPVEWKNPSLRLDALQTCTRILVHGCDKQFLNLFHRRYKCKPALGLVSLASSPGCAHLNFEYYDVVRCDRIEVKGNQYVPAIIKRPACIPVV